MSPFGTHQPGVETLKEAEGFQEVGSTKTEATTNELECLEQESNLRDVLPNVECLEQAPVLQDAWSLMSSASRGIREAVASWPDGFMKWCLNEGKKPKVERVEACFDQPPNVLVPPPELESRAVHWHVETTVAVLPDLDPPTVARDPEPQRGHQRTRPKRNAGPPLWPIEFGKLSPRPCLVDCDAFCKAFECSELEINEYEVFTNEPVPVFELCHTLEPAEDVLQCHLMKPLLQPLFFSNLEDLNLASWWLMDSGASRSVISSKFIERYEIVKTRDLEQPLGFSTASGQRVEISREVVIKVQVELYSRDKQVVMPVSIRALVSDVEYNLLSVVEMARKGWEFVVNQKECVVSTGQFKLYPIMWANCPWLKVHDVDAQSPHDAAKSVRNRRVRIQGEDDRTQVDSMSRSRSPSGSSHGSQAEGKTSLVRSRKASPVKRDQGFTKNGLKAN